MKPEQLVARLLLGGDVVGVTLMVLGVTADVESRHGAGPGRPWVTADRAPGSSETIASFEAIRRSLGRWPPGPLGAAYVGITVVLITPILGVGAAAGAFWAAGDYRYVLVAALALVIIAASIAIGRGG